MKFSPRKGDTIHFDGTVTHTWKDTYNFTAGKSGGDGALQLQKHRGAKPFDIGAAWTQRVTGTVRIRGSELSEPNFQWRDVND